MAQGKNGHAFHPNPRQGNFMQQQGFNNQHIESMQQHHFQGSQQRHIIPEGYFHSSAQQNGAANMPPNGFVAPMQQSNLHNFHSNMQQNNLPVNMQHVEFHGNINQSSAPGNVNHSNHLGSVQQHAAQNMFGGAPHTSFQGHFLVPVKAEVEQLPIAQLRDRVMEFVQVGRVNFDTLVFHTGSGELHRLGFYFNQHIMSIVVLNAMFNNSSQGDRAQFNQVVYCLKIFNADLV